MLNRIAIIILAFATALPSAAIAKKKTAVSDDKLTCKQIVGRMQVQIMTIRDHGTRAQSSALSRGIQSGFAMTFGNLDHGVDPEGEYATEVKQLNDYNQRLVAMGCNSYDLQFELNQKDMNETPSPTVPPPKKDKAQAASSTPAAKE
jgi:hypothetical protein